MAKLLQCLLLFFIYELAFGAPQSDLDNANDLDYSAPGLPSEDCVCVPFEQCVTDGAGMLDARQGPRRPGLALDEEKAPSECGPFHTCCKIPDASTDIPYEHKCGIRNPGSLNGRIMTPDVTGEADFGEWPWQAAVLKRASNENEFIFKCGGTLIDNRHVLTVAHCVDKLLNYTDRVVVRLGEWDTQKTNEFQPHEDFNVSEIIIHSQYGPNNLHNDIAILKLNKEVTFKPHIATACLPRDEDDFTGQDCVVTGWGTNAYKNGTFSVIMKEVIVPVLNNGECQNMLRKTRLGPYFKLHDGFLCAGGNEGKDSCKGDGGGPLVCSRSDNSYTVAGLVAWGIDCGQPNVPGVYVNVRKYIDWIVSKTEKPLEEYWSSQ